MWFRVLDSRLSSGGVGPAPRLPVRLRLPDYVALVVTAADIALIFVL